MLPGPQAPQAPQAPATSPGRCSTSRWRQVFARYYLACALTAVEHLHQLRVMLRSLKPEAQLGIELMLWGHISIYIYIYTLDDVYC